MAIVYKLYYILILFIDLISVGKCVFKTYYIKYFSESFIVGGYVPRAFLCHNFFNLFNFKYIQGLSCGGVCPLFFESEKSKFFKIIIFLNFFIIFTFLVGTSVYPNFCKFFRANHRGGGGS